ncbi:hypothetical protein GCM10009753_22460 [Streptantibioticus ferralitis]
MSGVSWQAGELIIGELWERSGAPASALCFHERQGLIDSRRTSGNQRRYARYTLRRVAFIRVSQWVGIPPATIREALSLLPDGRTPRQGGPGLCLRALAAGSDRADRADDEAARQPDGLHRLRLPHP